MKILEPWVIDFLEKEKERIENEKEKRIHLEKDFFLEIEEKKETEEENFIIISL